MFEPTCDWACEPTKQIAPTGPESCNLVLIKTFIVCFLYIQKKELLVASSRQREKKKKEYFFEINQWNYVIAEIERR